MNDEAGARFFEAERRLYEAFANRDGWRPSRAEPARIRASFLASLIVGRPAFARLTEDHGVVAGEELSPDSDLIIDGEGRVEIVGDLDLSRQRFARNIFLSGSRLEGKLRLDDATSGGLTLRGCRLAQGLSAPRAEFRGALEACNLEIADELNLEGSTIRGTLTARGLKCLKDSAAALTALTVEGRIDIEGLEGFCDLDLSDLRAGRSVRFSNLDLPTGLCLDYARIGGGLTLSAMKLGQAGDSNALSAKGVKIDGSVVVGNKAEGRVRVGSGGVRFAPAAIGGDLDLRGLSSFGCDSEGVSVYVRNATIDGSVRLDRMKQNGELRQNGEGPPQQSWSFEAVNGSVLFHTVKIGGGLQFAEAFLGGFNKRYRNSVSVYGCTIGGKLELSKFKRKTNDGSAQVNLKHGRIDRPQKAGESPREPCLGVPINAHGGVSPRICLIRTHAAVLEIGAPLEDDKAFWSLFDAERRQLSLKGLTYDGIEETTKQPKDWERLLDLSTPFIDEPKCKGETIADGKYHRGHRDRKRRDDGRVDPFDAHPWTQTAKVLDLEGRHNEARKIRFQRDRRDYKKASNCVIQFWGCLLDKFIGFGHKPHRAPLIALASIVAGWIAFCSGYHHYSIAPSQEEVMLSTAYTETGEPPYSYPEFAPFIYSMDIFLPVVELGQAEYWRPAHRVDPNNDKQACVWVAAMEWITVTLRMLGWLTFAFGVIAFTPIVKRD